MKKIIFILLISTSVFSQTEKVEYLEITPLNVNGFVVREYEGKSASEIYIALKKWTQYNINNADYATNSDVQNEYLSFKINGVGEVKYKDSNKWLWRLNLYVEARIKDDKLRLDIRVMAIDGVGELDDITILPSGGVKSMSSLFKKDGSPRNATVSYRQTINRSLNDFANDIFTSIVGKVDYKKTDW